ncbi:DUF2834 domain-containing protein [Cognatilysobacter bugurensis]|uniref:DUF2834 domain-containing protein n=1 Tax=Cognatilysobacter bugurensis TaxID=543356 RepID=A0A918SX67_9GAMM|nr:DUF2834 domain-containing protein [Lysobacter bugurensis]GHA76833.1 hypothetical protein GCM10007067_12640 [Lysobacter bugurensis]
MTGEQTFLKDRTSRALLWLLAAVGLVVPWFFNVTYFLNGGSVAPNVFFRDVGANALTTAITWDVYIAATAFSLIVARDAALGRLRWAYVIGCFCIGLSFALPLYAAHRLLGKR